MCALPALAKYSGGSGTLDDPYQTATAADLIALSEDPNGYDKHFILTADIDPDPNLPGRKVFDEALIAPDLDQTWDGLQGLAFSVVLDGNDHTISHLTITGQGYLGLSEGLTASTLSALLSWQGAPAKSSKSSDRILVATRTFS